MRVTIAALGDLGRSPRMQYHALALANCGSEVDLIGYRGTRCAPDIENHERISIRRMRDPLAHTAQQRTFSVGRALCRAVLQHLQLLWALVFATAKPDAILVQNPPAIPTLGVAWFAARLRGARLVVDWHNFSWSRLTLKTGGSHPAVRLTRFFERAFGRLAEHHLCVSRAMRQELAERWGILDAVVLYDRPAAHFEKMTAGARPAALRRLLAEYVPGAELWRDDSQRPACLVCPTSWSDDEDLSLLLDALVHLDRRIREDTAVTNLEFPNLLVLITGRGPLRECFEARIAGLSLRHMQICTTWISARDYPRMLAASDIGLCFHRSASGVDLPIKLADMFGVGLPVCAFDYGPCLAERLVHGDNGLTHTGSQQLADQLYELFAGFPEKTPTLDQLRRGVEEGDVSGWLEGWRNAAGPIFFGEVGNAEEWTAQEAVESPGSLRIAFFHPDLGIGGAERWLIDAASSLQRAGHRVTVITSQHDPTRCFEETRDGTLDIRVRGSFLPSHIGHRLRAPCALARSTAAIVSTALRGERFDIAFVDLVPHVIPLLRGLGTPGVIYYCHYPDQLMTPRRSRAYQLYRQPIDRLEKKAVARADRVLVNSRFTAAAARRVFGEHPAGAPEVLHPGVAPADASESDPVGPAAEEANDGHLTLLCISRFDRRKRLGLAVEALAALAQRLDPATFARTRLVIAGGYDPALREPALALGELRSLASELGVLDRVEFSKSPKEPLMRDLLSRCCCVIYTPEEEHFGLVPLEAMAAGRPVVAVRSGGPLETIRDGETGLLCSGTPDAFADAIAQLLRHPEDSERMGRAGRDWVDAHFSRRAFAERLTEIVEELVISGDRRPA
jgi:glycosyltransferase involved in cell wall biosynthesis